jgi:integrase
LAESVRVAPEPIFKRADGGLWGKSRQLRLICRRVGAAKIKPAVSFHLLRHMHAWLDARHARRRAKVAREGPAIIP